MSIRISQWNTYTIGLLGLLLCFEFPSQAQPFGGGFGGFSGGGSGGGGRRSGSGATRQYPNNGMIGDALISTDPETRRVIVITDDETSQFVSQVITNLDRPKPQVLIKVVFVEVHHTDSLDLGVQGNFTKNINSTPTTVDLANRFGLSPLPVPPGGGIYSLASKEYEVTLRAIAQAGRAEVLSRPSILARNNQPATINVGQSVPLVTGVRYDNFGNVINTFTYSSVGIILQVTPFITSEGMVEMIVSPEISKLADKSQWVPISYGTTNSASASSAPVIDTRRADTVVVTPDGQTIVIGGLMQTIKEKTETKIPLLGDIPLLGLLFRHRVTSTDKTELIIFLTPYIVRTPAEMAALSDKERALMQKSYSEQELDRLLNGLPSKQLPATGPQIVPGATNSAAPPK